MHFEADARAGPVRRDFGGGHPAAIHECVEIVAGSDFQVHVLDQQARVFLIRLDNRFLCRFGRFRLTGLGRVLFLAAGADQQCERKCGKQSFHGWLPG